MRVQKHKKYENKRNIEEPVSNAYSLYFWNAAVEATLYQQ